jgi:hypothetical protein
MLLFCSFRGRIVRKATVRIMRAFQLAPAPSVGAK